MRHFAVLIAFALLIRNICGMEHCTTSDNKNTPSPKQSCVFPFSYKDVTYEECTSHESEHFWCGTESVVTDEVGWGYCDDECFKDRDEHNETQCGHSNDCPRGSTCDLGVCKARFNPRQPSKQNSGSALAIRARTLA